MPISPFYVRKTYISGEVYPTSNSNYVPVSEGGKGNAGVSTCHATGDASCNGN